jgi:hypothetical protein
MEEDSSSRGASILEGELEVLSAQLASHRRMKHEACRGYHLQPGDRELRLLDAPA